MIHSNKTIQYSAYNRTGGRAEYLNDTTNYKRPDLEYLTETLKGAGIAGEMDIPSVGQLSAMEIEIGLKKTGKQAYDMFAPKAQHLEVRWVSDQLDTANNSISSVGNKDIIIGIPKKFGQGTIETNSSNEASLTLEVLYFNHIVNGKSLIEIDKTSNVYKINGKDYLAELRSLL